MADRRRPDSTNVRTLLWRRAVPALFRGLEHTAPSLAGWWADRLFFTPPRPRLSPRLGKVMATARPFPVPFPSGELPAWRWGRGPTVALIHGWGSRAGHLAAFVGPLVEAGFSPVAFDAPAHGSAPGRRTNVPEMSRALDALARAAGPLHGVVAHSAGAAATALALHGGLAVGRVVFLAPAGNPEGFTRVFAQRIGLGETSLRAMRARAERRIGLRFDELNVCTLARGQRAPLLVVHDEDDVEIGWHDGAAVAEAWPGAELVTTHGLGHHRVLKDAGVVARAAAFLGGKDGRGCGHEGGCAWNGSPDLCPSCALDQELYDRQARWIRPQTAAYFR